MPVVRRILLLEATAITYLLIVRDQRVAWDVLNKWVFWWVKAAARGHCWCAEAVVPSWPDAG